MYDQIELYMEPENVLEKMEEPYCEMTSAERGFFPD